MITELSNSLFLLLCLKDVITRLSYLWIFYTSVSENISKSSKKIFNLLHPKAVIIAIKYEFSSCSVSKLWSEGSLCEFVSSLFQSNDQGAQILFSIHSISKQWSKWSSLISNSLSLKVVIRKLNVLILSTLCQTSDHRAQRLFSYLFHFKALIRELRQQLWSVLSKSSDHRAQALTLCLLCLKTVIIELRQDFWSALSQNRNQRAQVLTFYLLSLKAVITKLR